MGDADVAHRGEGDWRINPANSVNPEIMSNRMSGFTGFAGFLIEVMDLFSRESQPNFRIDLCTEVSGRTCDQTVVAGCEEHKGLVSHQLGDVNTRLHRTVLGCC